MNPQIGEIVAEMQYAIDLCSNIRTTDVSVGFVSNWKDRLKTLMTDKLEALGGCEARPLAEYHEDMGPVTWWKFPVNEPSWVGSTLDCDWPGYHTHFTPHPPMPAQPKQGESND